ncbi:MAG: hypothetical protein ACM4AI_17315 [Acidobacteriota bacterium]
MSVKTHVQAVLGVTLGCLLFAAACSESPMRTSPSPIGARGTNATNVGTLELNKFEVCKVYSGIIGPSVVINFTVDNGNNGSVEQTGSVTLANNGCAEIHTGTAPDFIDKVTVTEVVPAGYTASFVKTQGQGAQITTTNGTGNTTFGFTIDTDGGALVVFTNTSNPTVVGEGRFTGGGQIELANGVTVSNGLTLHCDLILSNNLEVNWKDANGVQHQFHLEDHLQTIECSDHNNIDQNPPPAPLDTMTGVGVGRLDGEDGWTIQFTLVDSGEPGGGEDQIALKIFKGSTIALNFTLQDTTKGNLQAHFDQPHK